MRYFAPLVAAFAAVATAQSTNSNAFNIPVGGYQIVANEPVTLTWSHPTSGTVTIKLQQGAGTGPGLVLASGISATGETATVTIPGDEVNSSQYFFEIVDEQEPSVINYSTNFVVAGASATGTSFATNSAVASTAAASGSTGTSTALETAATTSGASASTSISAATTGESSAAATTSVSTAPSTTSSSQSSGQTTSAPDGNSGAASLRVQGGLVAAVLAAIAVF